MRLFRPRGEKLESRHLLAGIPITPLLTVATPSVLVRELATPVLDIKPNAVDVVMETFDVSVAGHTPAEFQEALLIPRFGSEPLYANTTNITLRADLDGNARNGFETIVGSGFANYPSDVVDVQLFHPFWVTAGHSVSVQVTANFGLNPSGNHIGTEIGQIITTDLRGNVVPDSRVTYRGTTTLHTMESHVLQIFQNQMSTNSDVVAGQTGVDLLEFGTWTNASEIAPLRFTAAEGSLLNGQNYQLVHHNYLGAIDQVYGGVVSGTQLVFSPTFTVNNGGTWMVMADIVPANRLASHVLRLAMPTTISATDLSTHRAMQGQILNGVGAGQVEIWRNVNFATHFDIATVAPTGLLSAVVDGTTPLNQSVAGNQTVVVGKFKTTATGGDYTITEMKVVLANPAAAVLIQSASLMDGSTVLATVPYDSTKQVFSFTGLNINVPANTNKVLSVALSLATPFTSNVVIGSGLNAKVELTSVKALDSHGVVVHLTPNSFSNDLWVYKTVPTFASVPVTGQGASLSAGSSTSLYSFSVTADAAGPVALKQLKLSISVADLNASVVAKLASFRLFRGATDLTGAGVVSILDSSGNDLTTSTSRVPTGTVVLVFNTEEVIPVGVTYTYTLKATPTGFSVSSTNGADSITTTLMGDSTPFSGVNSSAAGYLSSASNSSIVLLKNDPGNVAAANANVIWTDYSAQIHDYTPSDPSSDDFFNGYLLSNFPLAATTITAQ